MRRQRFIDGPLTLRLRVATRLVNGRRHWSFSVDPHATACISGAGSLFGGVGPSPVRCIMSVVVSNGAVNGSFSVEWVLLSAWVEHVEDRFGLAGWICSRRAYSGLVWEEFGGFFRWIFGSQLILKYFVGFSIFGAVLGFILGFIFVSFWGSFCWPA
jgi:hypothetical protein